MTKEQKIQKTIRLKKFIVLKIRIQHQGNLFIEPAVVALIVSASISHSVDVASWRSVVRIPLRACYSPLCSHYY